MTDGINYPKTSEEIMAIADSIEIPKYEEIIDRLRAVEAEMMSIYNDIRDLSYEEVKPARGKTVTARSNIVHFSDLIDNILAGNTGNIG